VIGWSKRYDQKLEEEVGVVGMGVSANITWAASTEEIKRQRIYWQSAWLQRFNLPIAFAA
jgi:hypothetical protein